MRNVLIVLLALLIAGAGAATPAFAQEPAKRTKKSAANREYKWQGSIVRSSKDNSTLTVRGAGNIEKIVVYAPSTKWTRGSKQEAATMDDFKDGSNVIVLGKYDDQGRLMASNVNLRLPR